jgi:hypothetical protein
MEFILASHERHAEMHTYETRGDTQLINRREDGIRGMDHSIHPRNSRDAEHHTYKHVAPSLVVQKVSLT